MKTILYMGISVNGYIAKEDGSVKWNSEEGWKSFYDHGKAAGNFIMGANTYRVAVHDGDFPFLGALNVVMSHEAIENKWGDQVIFTDKAPKDVLQMMHEKGFQTAFLIGGGKLNSSFIKDHIIDEIYLDVESIALGKGIPVFEESDFEVNLRFLETKKLGPNTVQLHYKVLK